MQKGVLRYLGVLVIAALTIQTATAATSHSRKDRNPAPATHRIRDAYGLAPDAVGTRSCDVIWCYEN